MTEADYRRLRASNAMWLIRRYYHDLSEYFAGDLSRFSRMVVDGGKPLATASPAGWTQHIVNCTTQEAIEFYRHELTPIYGQLIAWGLLSELPEGL